MRKVLLSFMVSGILSSIFADTNSSFDKSKALYSSSEIECTTDGGYQVATHTMGEASVSNGLIYFRTLTPFPLSIYYKTPTNYRVVNRTIDLNYFTFPDTDYKFFLEVSPLLATGETFYVKGNGECYFSYFPKMDGLNNDDGEVKNDISSEIEVEDNIEEFNKKELKLFTKDEFSNLSSGWHLVGTGVAIDDMSIFGNSKESIWIFQNNTWINNIEEIKPLQGFWIKK